VSDIQGIVSDYTHAQMLGRLLHAINEMCDCGGNTPDSPDACIWCDLWHYVIGNTDKLPVANDAEVAR
jgi:hypothetical protein